MLFYTPSAHGSNLSSHNYNGGKVILSTCIQIWLEWGSQWGRKGWPIGKQEKLGWTHPVSPHKIPDFDMEWEKAIHEKDSEREDTHPCWGGLDKSQTDHTLGKLGPFNQAPCCVLLSVATILHLVPTSIIYIKSFLPSGWSPFLKI